MNNQAKYLTSSGVLSLLKSASMVTYYNFLEIVLNSPFLDKIKKNDLITLDDVRVVMPTAQPRDVLNLLECVGVVNVIGLKEAKLTDLFAFLLRFDELKSLRYWLQSCLRFDLNDLLKKNHSRSDNNALWVKRYAENSTMYAQSFQWLACYSGYKLAENLGLRNKNVQLILDVGCGTGGLLSAYLSRNHSAKGIGLDLSAPIGQSGELVDKFNVQNRVKYLAGDMYDFSLPYLFDAVVLSWILHDLSDSNCISVLSNCADHLKASGEIYIIETTENTCSNEYRSILSIEVSAATNEGFERTLDEYGRLLNKVGLCIDRVHDLDGARSLIVAKKVAKLSNNKKIPKIDILESYLAECKSDIIEEVRVFGNRSESRSDDDLLIILKKSTSFVSGLNAIVDLLRSIKNLNLYDYYFPSFELKCLLNKTKGIVTGENVLNLLVYSSIQDYCKTESSSFRSKLNIDCSGDACFVAQEYSDLYRKILNSLILMLSVENLCDSGQVLKLAVNIADYIAKWAPIKPTGKLEEILDFNSLCNYYNSFNQ